MKKIILSIAVASLLFACEGQHDGTKTGMNEDVMKRDGEDHDIMKSNSNDPDSSTVKMDTTKVSE